MFVKSGRFAALETLESRRMLAADWATVAPPGPAVDDSNESAIAWFAAETREESRAEVLTIGGDEQQERAASKPSDTDVAIVDEAIAESSYSSSVDGIVGNQTWGELR